MKSIVVATKHLWSINNAKRLCDRYPDYRIEIISAKDELTSERLETLAPEYVFFPHWSWIIPAQIHENFCCVVFHMTDLPFGRGGSPLQNLISRGIRDTKISAIKVTDGIDAGDVYMKEPLSLYGSAEEIYMRGSDIIFSKMIPYIIENKPDAVRQTGEVTFFERRTPDMSELVPSMTLGQIFDYIQMLDAEGYPKAFINFGKYKLRFSRAKRTGNGIVADVEIGEESAAND